MRPSGLTAARDPLPDGPSGVRDVTGKEFQQTSAQGVSDE